VPAFLFPHSIQRSKTETEIIKDTEIHPITNITNTTYPSQTISHSSLHSHPPFNIGWVCCRYRLGAHCHVRPYPLTHLSPHGPINKTLHLHRRLTDFQHHNSSVCEIINCGHYFCRICAADSIERGRDDGRRLWIEGWVDG
jgi:hypothetical protein